MDYREKSNRREAFIEWFSWSIKFGDCDPSIWMTNYINSRYEHNSEQKLWLCWLYGNTYNLPTTWVLLNEFPDYELATFDRMNQWNTDNYMRLRYQIDTKWNKGHLPVMFQSYQKFIGNTSQEEKFESLYVGSAAENFDNIWKNVKNDLHKFGRYSTWFYMQHLKHTANLKIEPTSLMLSDYSGSKSHRNGLLLALGRDEEYDTVLTDKQYQYLEMESASIISEMHSRFPKYKNEIDLFAMETCLCSFKKIFRNSRTRFLGYYLGRQLEEIRKSESDLWTGIDWNVLHQSRSETLDNRLLDVVLNSENKSKSQFLEYGTLASPWEANKNSLSAFFS